MPLPPQPAINTIGRNCRWAGNWLCFLIASQTIVGMSELELIPTIHSCSTACCVFERLEWGKIKQIKRCFSIHSQKTRYNFNNIFICFLLQQDDKMKDGPPRAFSSLSSELELKMKLKPESPLSSLLLPGVLIRFASSSLSSTYLHLHSSEHYMLS